jgi:hypothetical protein
MFKFTFPRIAAACVVIVTLFAGSAAAAPVVQRKAGPATERGTQSRLMQAQQFIERHLEIGFFVTGGQKSAGTKPWLQPKLDPGETPCPPCNLGPPQGHV